MEEHTTQMTLEEIRLKHLAHGGFIWQCPKKINGEECRHLYEAALIRESERQIAFSAADQPDAARERG